MYKFLNLIVLVAGFGAAIYGFVSVFGPSGSHAKQQHQSDNKIIASKPVGMPAGRLGIGVTATSQQIAGWDIDIRPDGMGLPEGSGSVEDGEKLYEVQCAHCHGTFGEGEGRWPIIAGGAGTLTATGEERPLKTIGSYWPYASTLWDYIRRAMPFTAPLSLSADETYAITAYVLHLNDLVEYDFVLSKNNFSAIKLPNQDNFYMDDRPDTNNTACMSDCRDSNSIRVTSAIAGLTPVAHFRAGADSPAATHSGEDPTQLSVVATGSIEGEHGEAAADLDSKETLMVTGEKVYKANCAVCHQVNGEGVGATFPALKDNDLVLGDVAAHIDVILNGKPGTAMVGFGRFSDHEFAAVVTYQRNAWGNQAEVDLVTAAQVAAQR